MFLLKLFGKMFLLPVLLMVGVLRLILWMFLEVSSFPLGLALTAGLGLLAYFLICQIWLQAFIMGLADAALVAALFCAGQLQGALQLASEGIRNGTKRKDRFKERLTPEGLAQELDEYQEVFGDSFGLDELLRLEQIRSNALIAEAINDAPEFLLDQIG